jgi:hypothetical protein
LGRSSCITTAGGDGSADETTTSSTIACVVVVLPRWLQQLEWNAKVDIDEVAHNDRSDDQDEEQNEHGKVEDSEADDSPLSKARLLERVDGWPDLTTVKKLASVVEVRGQKEHTLVGARKA